MNAKKLPVLQEYDRPRSRLECEDGERPCPFISCRHHLLLDVASDGKLLKPRDFDEDDEDSIAFTLLAMPETCSRDVAERYAHSEMEVAELLNSTRQSINLTEHQGRARALAAGLPPRYLQAEGD